jgi:hypothetical protein
MTNGQPQPGSASVPADHVPGRPWKVPAAAAFLRVSDRHLWRLIAAREVKVIRLGRATLIPDAEMTRILAGE